MEVILDCYFDHIFSTLDRGCLMASYKRRQLVDYFSTVIKGCCNVEDELQVRTAVGFTVRRSVRYHTESRESNSAVCMLGKFHNILYIAVKLCCDWKLDDPDAIAEVLDSIYRCEKSFERIFVGALVGVRATSIISGWKCDFADKEENVRAVEYLLGHAVRQRLVYNYGEGFKKKLRFVDVPMDSYGCSSPVKVAIQMGDLEMLGILLRHGARLDLNLDKESEALYVNLTPLISRLNEAYEVCVMPRPETRDVSCLKLILRAIPGLCLLTSTSISEQDSKSPLERCRSFSREEELSIYVRPELINEDILPPSRCGISPPELKHLCRCAVSHSLWLSWQLPVGIYKLSVPSSLHKYLNLEEN